MSKLVVMTSHASRLCLQCRSLLCSMTSAAAWHCPTQARHCSVVMSTASKVLRGSSVFTGRHRTTPERQTWTQQVVFYSDLQSKHLSPEAKEKKNTEEVSNVDVVLFKKPLTPDRDDSSSDNLMSLDLDAAPKFSALDVISDEEAISLPVPCDLPPVSDSLRDYVDKSETLTKLVQLGVKMWKLEQRRNVGSMLLRLDFDTEVAPRLMFLKDIGVDESRFGHIITHNPFILTESLESLQTRVNYLKSRKFSSEDVASMVARAPYLLNFSVKRLDNRLGFYQQILKLSPSNTRNIVSRLPRLLCGSLEPVKENLKVCQIEFGFKENEIQHIILAVPKVLTANKTKLTQIFDFVHNTMKIPHQLITKFPRVFDTRHLRLKERHLFLEYLGKAQYDPTLPGYISLDRVAILPDESFCSEVAAATLEDFYLFQKTM